MTLPLESLQEFDIDAGLMYADGDQELYLEVLAMFHEQLVTEFANLPQQLSAPITDETARQVHTLKGSASSVGATQIEAAAKTIDQRIKEGVTAIDAALLEKLNSAMTAAVQALNLALSP